MTALSSPRPSGSGARDFPCQFLSLEAVAQRAGVAHDVAYRWVRTGELTSIRFGPSQWRVEQRVLQAFLRDRPAPLTLAHPAS